MLAAEWIPFAAERFSFVVEHIPFVDERVAFIVERVPFVVERIASRDGRIGSGRDGFELAGVRHLFAARHF